MKKNVIIQLIFSVLFMNYFAPLSAQNSDEPLVDKPENISHERLQQIIENMEQKLGGKLVVGQDKTSVSLKLNPVNVYPQTIYSVFTTVSGEVKSTGYREDQPDIADIDFGVITALPVPREIIEQLSYLLRLHRVLQK